MPVLVAVPETAADDPPPAGVSHADPEFVEAISLLAEHGHHRSATALIFSRFDAWANAGQWDLCNDTLAAFDPARLTSFQFRSLLTITYPFRDQLPARPEFLETATNAVTASKGADYAHRLFRHMD